MNLMQAPGPAPSDAALPAVRVAVVPAAGLGTRLVPATLAVDKELLPLGVYPAMVATLLEADAAGIEEVVVVLSPGKERVRRFLSPQTWPRVSGAEDRRLAPLRALLSRLFVRFVEQPHPCGALDAIERGLSGVELPCAVLYPDLLHLPDQQGLAALLAAYARCRQMVFGLYRMPADAAAGLLHGPSARALLDDPGPGDDAGRGPPGPLRLAGILPPTVPPAPGEVRTTFGYIHTAACTAALSRAARPAEGQSLDDRRYLDALNLLCAAGQLFGVMLPGEVLDLGIVPGYLDAARRFATGEAALRGLA